MSKKDTLNYFAVPNCLEKIKEEIQKFIPEWFHKYILSNKTTFSIIDVFPTDETALYAILKNNLKSATDFHLFYRWMGLESSWAVKGRYQGLSPTLFWSTYYIDRQTLGIISKLLRDYQAIYEKHNGKII